LLVLSPSSPGLTLSRRLTTQPANHNIFLIRDAPWVETREER
jgi:hypothetical protein